MFWSRPLAKIILFGITSAIKFAKFFRKKVNKLHWLIHYILKEANYPTSSLKSMAEEIIIQSQRKPVFPSLLSPVEYTQGWMNVSRPDIYLLTKFWSEIFTVKNVKCTWLIFITELMSLTGANIAEKCIFCSVK